MVLEQDKRARCGDVSLLIKESLKGFNKLKCSVDDSAYEVRPFFESNQLLENASTIALKHHYLKSAGRIGSQHPHNAKMKNMETFRHSNERFLDELSDHLRKQAGVSQEIITIGGRFKYDGAAGHSVINNNYECQLIRLAERANKVSLLSAECEGLSNKGGVRSDLGYYSSKTPVFQGDDNEGRELSRNAVQTWEKFKSDFVTKYSEYQLTNTIGGGVNDSKQQTSVENAAFVGEQSSYSHINVSTMHRRVHLNPDIKNKCKIIVRDLNMVLDAEFMGLTELDMLYTELVVMYNNQRRSSSAAECMLTVVDTSGSEVAPVEMSIDMGPHNALQMKSQKEDIPLGVFVWSNIGRRVANVMFSENWSIVARHMALLRHMNRKSSTNVQTEEFRNSKEFENMVIDASWTHLCLKERYELSCAVGNENISNTMELVCAYHSVNDNNNGGVGLPNKGGGSQNNDNLLWKCIYSAIRCGDMIAVWRLAERLSLENVAFTQFIRAFVNNNHDTIDTLREAMAELYDFEDDCQFTIKRLVFSFFLNLNDTNFYGYFATLDDYVWYKLASAHYFKSQSLKDIQSDISDKVAHLALKPQVSSNNHPLRLVQALLYVGNYSAAVSYLYDLASCLPHTVHLAVALYLEGALPLKESSQMGTIPTNVDFEDLFARHVQDMASANVDLAVEYILLFKYANPSLVIKLTTLVALQTPCISRLFGNVMSDEKIMKDVAMAFENNKDFYSALRIYDILKQYKKVVKLINILLCEAICVSLAGKKRKKIVETAYFIYTRMVKQNWQVDEEQRTFFDFLHYYMKLQDHYYKNDSPDILQFVDTCRFIPTTNQQIYNYKKLIKHLPPIAFKFLGNFIELVVKLLHRQYVDLNSADDVVAEQNQKATIVKNRILHLVKMFIQMCNEAIIPNDSMKELLSIENLLNHN